MKSLILAIAATLALTSFAHAADEQCAFGEETWQLKDELESEETGKIFYGGDYVSLSRPERINGLTKFERELILIVAGAGQNEAEEALLGFQSADGYIQYFQPNADRRQFVMVASYPGDNEFGKIFEIKQKGRGPFEIVDVVAVIADSFLEDCKIKRSEIK